jgi:hypothetical protein
MVPSGDVIPTAIAVVLEADGVYEVCVLQFRVERFDFFWKFHYAALAK